jgi:hypothetical protein
MLDGCVVPIACFLQARRKISVSLTLTRDAARSRPERISAVVTKVDVSGAVPRGRGPEIPVLPTMATTTTGCLTESSSPCGPRRDHGVPLRAGRSWSRGPAIAFGYHRADTTERTAEKFVPVTRGSLAEPMLIFRASAMGQIPKISVSLSQVCSFCGIRLPASVPMTSLRAVNLLNFAKSVCSCNRKL